MSEFYLRVTTAGEVSKVNAERKVLVSNDTETHERLKRRPIDQALYGEFKGARNYEFLAKAFVMSEFAFGRQAVFELLEDFRFWSTVQAGFFKIVKDWDGRDIQIAKSWSYADMGPDEFELLYNALVDLYVSKSETLFNGVDAAELESDLLKFRE